MRNFARRVPVLDARFFVTAVLTQRETGGNLAEVLDNLGAVIRERFKVKRQVRVLSAHGRITGWVLAMLPPALAVATFIVNPHHLGTLIGDPLGRQMIVVAHRAAGDGHADHPQARGRGVLSVTPQLLLTLVAVFGAVAVVTGVRDVRRPERWPGPGRRRLRQAAQSAINGRADRCADADAGGIRVRQAHDARWCRGRPRR